MSSFKNFASMLSDLQQQADGRGTIAGSPIEDFLSIAGYETPGGEAEVLYPTFDAVWDEGTQSYSYTCDWTFSELKTKIAAFDSSSYPAIYNEEGFGCFGGTAQASGPDLLVIEFANNGVQLSYDSDGTITETNP